MLFRSPCEDVPARHRPESLRERSIRQLDEARSLHRRNEWPVPYSWVLTITPDQPLLAPGESTTIQVDVEPSWHDGQRSAVLNLNVFGVLEDTRNHLGGVTLQILNGQVA